MADLRLENPATTEAYRQAMADLSVTLPLDLHEYDLGVIVDAEGRDIITVDVNNERPDREVDLICHRIILAVNTCGGFRAEIVRHG